MSKQIFWLLSWTWGIVMTLIGTCVFGILILFGYKPYKNQYGYVIEIGSAWGGLEIGPYCLVNKHPSQRTLNHEFGHALQNCYFGPFMVFISIASAIRYWWREYLIRVKKKTYQELPDYDDIWFEGTATYLGTHYKNTYKL